MPRQISCPGCHAVYKLPDSTQGRQVRLKCKKCGRSFVAGGGAGKAAAKPQPRPAARRPARKKKSALVPALLLFILILLGAGAVEVYFLFFHQPQQQPVAQGGTNNAGGGGGTPTNQGGSDKGHKPPVVDPGPGPGEPPPVIEPGPGPGVEPPPAAVGLYQLKDPPTPPAAIDLPEPAHLALLLPGGKTAVLVVADKVTTERRVVLVEIPSGRALKTMSVPDQRAESLALLPDGKTVLVGGSDTRFPRPDDPVYLRAVSLETGTSAPVPGPKQPVVAVSVAPDGGLVACAGSDFSGARGVVHVLDLKTGATVFYRAQVHKNLIKGIALTPDKKYVISTGVDDGGGTSKVVVFDIAADQEKHVLAGYGGTAEGLAVSADGKLVAAAINSGNGGSVRVWDVETGAEKLALISNGSSGATHVAFGPGDKTVIATFYDASTRVFDAETGREEGGFRGHTIVPNVLALAPDGGTVATAYFRDLKLWQFPDALADLARPDQPEFVKVVRDGQGVGTKPPTPAEDPDVTVLRGATVETLLTPQNVRLSAGGKQVEVTLLPTARVLDAAGNPVPADRVMRICRIGNVVDVRVDQGIGSAVREMKLVREGPPEVTLAKATLSNVLYPAGATVKSGGQFYAVKFSPSARLLDLDGQTVPASEAAKFFNAEAEYTVKVRVDSGEFPPPVTEARSSERLAAKGREVVPFKNAVVTRMGKVQGLSLPGGESFRIAFSNDKTKAYDSTGKEVRPTDVLLKEGLVVDGVGYSVSGAGKFITEVRVVALSKSAEPADPGGPGEAVKGATVVQVKLNNSSRWYLFASDQKIPVEADAATKAYDGAGKEVAVGEVLKHGNKVDARYAAGNPKALLEIRIPAGEAPKNVKTYAGLKITSIGGGGTLYTLRKNLTTVKAKVTDITTSYDLAGNPTGVEQLMRLGEFVDVTVEERPGNTPILLEVRGSRGQ